MALLNVLSKQSNVLLLDIRLLWVHVTATCCIFYSTTTLIWELASHLRISPRPAINPFFEIGQPVLYRNNSMKMPTEASYIIHAGHNIAWIAMGDRTRFVSVDQLHSHDVKMLPHSQDAPLSHLASTPSMSPLQHQVSAQSTPASVSSASSNIAQAIKAAKRFNELREARKLSPKVISELQTEHNKKGNGFEKF